MTQRHIGRLTRPHRMGVIWNVDSDPQQFEDLWVICELTLLDTLTYLLRSLTVPKIITISSHASCRSSFNAFWCSYDVD